MKGARSEKRNKCDEEERKNTTSSALPKKLNSMICILDGSYILMDSNEYINISYVVNASVVY